MTKIENYSIFVLFLCFLKAINVVNCIKCYSCGEPNIFLGPEYANPPSCKEFEDSKSDELKKFIIDCPKSYLGCLTQKQGSRVTRTCDTFAFQDCQVANGVIYCYCATDLCNIHNITTQQTMYQSKIVARNLVDDEDYDEMSGFGSLDEHEFDEQNMHRRISSTVEPFPTDTTIIPPSTDITKQYPFDDDRNSTTHTVRGRFNLTNSSSKISCFIQSSLIILISTIFLLLQ